MKNRKHEGTNETMKQCCVQSFSCKGTASLPGPPSAGRSLSLDVVVMVLDPAVVMAGALETPESQH